MSGLTLTRRLGERVVVRHAGAEMIVTVIEIRGTQVKLAFTAPREFTVYRSEVQEQIDRESRDA